MSGGVIGEVDILIGGDATGFQRSIDKVSRSITNTVTRNLDQIASATPRELSKMVTSIGNSMQSVGGKLTGFVTAPILGAVTAATALTTALGFKRLVGIDTARGQFKGLGYDAEAVMKQVDAGVTNTALSMAQGASMAVGILATGAVPLGQLEDQIQRVANVSAAYNVDADRAAYLLNNVLTKQKVTWGDLTQMQQNNIPVVTALAAHFGVAGDELQKMATEGAISVEDLNAVLDDKAGAAALEYAKTWKGVTANILANTGKIGAKLMEPSFEIIKDKAADFLALLQSPEFANWADEMGAKIGNFVQKAIDAISNLINWWNNLSPAMQKFIGAIGLAAVAAGPFLLVIGKMVNGFGGLIKTFPGLGKAISGMAGMFSKGLTGATEASFTFAGRLGLIIQQGGGLLKFFGKFTGIVGAVVGAFVLMWQNSEKFREGIKGLFDAVWGLVSTAFSGLIEIFKALSPVFEAGGGIISKLAGIIGDLLGGALGLVIPGIEWLTDLLATGLTIAAEAVATAIQWLTDKFSEQGEGTKFLADAWEWLKNAWESIVGAFQTAGQWFIDVWNTITSTLSDLWNTISTTFTSVWQGIVDFFVGVWDAIMVPVQAVIDWFNASVLPVFQAIWEGITEAAQATMAWYQEHVAPVFESVGELITAIWDHISSEAEALWTALNVIWGLISDGWTVLWHSVQVAWDTVGAPVIELVKQAWGVLVTAAQLAWNTILGVIDTVWGAIKAVTEPAVNFIQNIVETVWEAAKLATEIIWGEISAYLEATWNGIQTVIEVVINVIKTIVETTWNVIKRISESVWNNIKNTLSTIWNVIKTVIETVLGVIKGIIDTVTNLIKGDWEGVWNSIKGIFETVWNGIKSIGETLLNSIKNRISNQINTIRDIWNTVWNGVKSIFSTIWNAIVSAATGFLNSVRNKFDTVMNFIRGIPNKVLNSFRNIGNLLKNSGKALVDGFLTGIKNAWSTLTGWVSDGLQKVRDLFPFSPAKTGPFSGRGWVDRAGYSLGSTFIESTADALNSGTRDVSHALGNVAGQFDDLATSGIYNVGETMAEQLARGLDRGTSTVERAAQALARTAQSEFDMRYGSNLSSSGIISSANQIGAEPRRGSLSTDNSRSMVIEKGAISVTGPNPGRTSLDVLDRIVEELGL